VFCRMIRDEVTEGTRILFHNDSFAAMIPYAALSRFHIWIFPTRHMAHFSELDDRELSNLGEALKTVLGQLYFGLGDPDFNLVIRTAPRGCADHDFHWYVSIVPRLGQAAGFELGSGMYINPSLPEESAAYLRSIRLPS